MPGPFRALSDGFSCAAGELITVIEMSRPCVNAQQARISDGVDW